MTAGRIPVMRINGPGDGLAAHEDWECADCGWTIDTAHLVAGWTIDGARTAHIDRYCAVPPTWL